MTQRRQQTHKGEGGQKKIPLPVDDLLPQLCESLARFPAAILTAPPGSGKTTRVPPALLEAGFLRGRHRSIVLLQPRRIAARAAAARIADENGWHIGGDMVGYQIRFERRLTPRTRIRVLTEGILTRQIIGDASLAGCGCVILDEFHERSIHTDLAISMLREIQQALRPDLRIVVMSATMDPEPVARFLGGAPVLHCEQRLHPVAIEHLARPDPTPRWELAARAARDAFVRGPATGGHTLVFLPGIWEIRRAEASLHGVDADIHVLHSSVSPEAQARALAPSVRPKVLLATNIAETSLTIDGVNHVIDTGLVRVQVHDPRLGIDRLEMQRVSRASAEQRAGRAGRTGPGRCLRLWTHEEHAGLAPASIPDVRRIDLASAVLALRAYGVARPAQFAWFEAPKRENLERAEELLRILGATDAQGQLTSRGKQLAALPLHPRLGCLLLEGARCGLLPEAASIAAFLGEEGLVNRGATRREEARFEVDSDLLDRLEHLEDARGDIDPVAMQRFRRVRDELVRLCAASPAERRRPRFDAAKPLCRLLLYAYPDRLTLRRPDDRIRGLMVGGRGVVLEPGSGVRRGELFLSIDLQDPERLPGTESRVAIASVIEAQWLQETHPDLLTRRTVHRFDPERNAVISSEQTRFLDLVIRERGVRTDADPEARARALFDHLSRNLDALIAGSDISSGWLQRVEFLRRYMPELGVPAPREELLPPALEEACMRAGTGGQVSPSVLVSCLENRLSGRQRAALTEHAPTHLKMPSGGRARVQYDDNGDASVSVRLHEVFGLAETPRIAAGRVAVRMQLLGPNHRPVQVTSDLRSFWNNTYAEVRRELRVKYPRLTWPENPWEAAPIRVGRKRTA
jgi:ATP-dependent helicase HrpB